MAGGTTFHFVTEGFDAVYARALEVAGDAGIHIAGGASTVRQALAAGVVDELTLDIAPVLLGAGERIFDGIGSFGFEPVETLNSPLATHVRYRRTARHVPAPGEPSVPEIEVDETVPPRPEEEVADVLRADPDVEDHGRAR